MARLAIELLLNIAGRRQDAHMLGRQHINRHGKLSWRPQKTRRSTGKTLTISIMPELQAAIDGMAKSDAMAFLCTDHGRPFASAAAFGNKFADWCTAAGLKSVTCDDGRVRNYRAHGLRKAALRALAHAGCTGSEMMNVSGHSSLHTAAGVSRRGGAGASGRCRARPSGWPRRPKPQHLVTNLADPDLQTEG